ncbi:hypothetical protein L227DRAFT_259028 [Lentinus tigrinus ALCF2SS1-6]|uniref:Uncharacterized protein n=1 Tax=Lentinus tigrinus ALCF2SS1-6 TaxID=1328759 RepID=A0A5C2RZF5_9APHY|nr:hypothetical protein L227DRAFT_259028 [Lentinus tigrinus ALCF2SS1-6]
MEDFAIAIQETSIHDLILATSIDRSYLYRSFDSGWSALNRSESDVSDTPESRPALPVATRSEREDSRVRTVRAPKPPRPLSAEEQMMEDFDVAAYTRRLVNALPSLQKIEIVIRRPRNQGRRVATLAGDGSRTVEYVEYDK